MISRHMKAAPRLAAAAGSLAAFAQSLVSERALEDLWNQRAALRGNEDFDEVLAVTEYAILGSEVTGPRAAEMRLWLALVHHPGVAGEADQAAHERDFEALKKNFALLDWDVKLIVGALAALRGETVHV